ncbi:MAG: hypothetical protein ACLVJ6_15575 [Merdibacter sp.]
MKSHERSFTLQAERAVGEYERSVQKLSYMLAFTKAYYQNVEPEVIELLPRHARTGKGEHRRGLLHQRQRFCRSIRSD